MKKLFFTGGGGAGNEAIFNLLSGQYESHFGDADIQAISCSIPERFRHLIPFASSDDFIERLNLICKQNGIDLVIPGVDEELLMMHELDVPVMLPEHAYVSMMLDKLTSATALAEAGLDSPLTITVEDFQSVKNFNFPCIAKPRSGRGSRNVNIVNSLEQVDSYLVLTGFAADEVVLQELLHGKEYTVMMSADSHGSLKAVVPVLIDVKRGITLRAETDSNQYVINGCIAIHERLPASGCYNIQLVYTEDNRVIPFEINPRVSTTFCLGLAAGINPVDIFLGNSSSNELMAYQSGVTLRRHWTNNFSMKES